MDRSEENIEQETTPENEHGEENSHPMDAFLEDETYEMDSPRKGEIRTGKIARISENDALVDIGYKSEGIIPGKELEHLPEEKRAELKNGSEVTVFILQTGSTILLSLSRAEEEKDWVDAQNLLKSKEVFEGVISGYNKGGLIVKLGSIRGFIPGSQVSIARRWRSEGDSPDQRWGSMVGEPVATKVIEVERRRNRLILSERAAAREARDALKQRLISELEPGEKRTGHVISLVDFGAFVDIGGADGLVHSSEISWKRISHPREVLKVGQEIEVEILALDPEKNRISLSIRELLPDPWDTIVEEFQEGQLVEGVITKLTKFGAFASLRGVSDYEVEGLIHISELSDRHIVHPREIVGESEALTLRIIRVDKERKRIGLSLKKVDSPEYAELDWKAAMKELETEEEDAEEAAGAEGEPEVDEVSEAPEAEGEPVSESEVDQVDEGAEAEGEPEVDEVSEAPEAEADEVGEAAEEEAEKVTAEADTDLEDQVEKTEAEIIEVTEQVDDEIEAAESSEVPEDEVEESQLSESLDVEKAEEIDEMSAVEDQQVTEAVDKAEVEEISDALEDAEGVRETEEPAEGTEIEEAGTKELTEEFQDELSEIENKSEIIEEKLAEEEDDPALKDEPNAPDEDGHRDGDGTE